MGIRCGDRAVAREKETKKESLMANEIFHATGTRILVLRKKLAARENTPGYEKNCQKIREEIARIEGSTLD